MTSSKVHHRTPWQCGGWQNRWMTLRTDPRDFEANKQGIFPWHCGVVFGFLHESWGMYESIVWVNIAGICNDLWYAGANALNAALHKRCTSESNRSGTPSKFSVISVCEVQLMRGCDILGCQLSPGLEVRESNSPSEEFSRCTY